MELVLFENEILQHFDTKGAEPIRRVSDPLANQSTDQPREQMHPDSADGVGRLIDLDSATGKDHVCLVSLERQQQIFKFAGIILAISIDSRHIPCAVGQRQRQRIAEP